jgi:homospermidine synthase
MKLEGKPKKTAEFKNKVLIIGYGSVSKCTLPIFLKHVLVPYENVTIIDFEDKSKELKPWTSKGVRFFRKPCARRTPNRSCLEH